MGFKVRDVEKINNILKKFGAVCPICGGVIFQGDIDEHYSVWCKCGLEMKFGFKEGK